MARCVFLLLLVCPLGRAQPTPTLFQQAAEALARADYAAAERGFQAVLQREPANVGALGNLGVAHSRQGRYDDAARVLTRALALSPGNPGLLLNLALVYVKQERWRDAKPPLAQLVEAHPNHAQAVELLATSQVHTGQAAEALPALERLRQAQPRNPGLLLALSIAYVRLGRADDARQAMDDLLSSATTPAQGHYLLGRAHLDAEQFEAAAGEFRQAAEADPSLPGLHREWGKSLVSLRQNEEAERVLRLALQRDTADEEARYTLGALLAQVGKPEGEALLEAVRRTRPDFWGTHYYLGKLRLQQGRSAQAIPLLERAVALSPEDDAVLYQLSRAYQAVGRGEEAKKLARKVAALKAARLGRETQP